MTKILVVRFSSIGDVVLTTPVIRCLKEQFEGGLELHYLTKSAYATLLEHNPHIDKLHRIDDSITEILPALKVENFNYIIDLHNNIRTKSLKSKLGVKSYTVDKQNVQKWKMVNFGVGREKGVSHIVDRYLETVLPLGIKDDGKGLDYYPPKNDHVTFSNVPDNFENGFTAVAVGAQYDGKKMPVEKLISVCSAIQSPIVLLGGPEDAAKGDAIASELGEKALNTCGKMTIHDSALVIKQAKVVVAHDTGLMHIATAFQKPLVSVWGCTSPAIGMAPFRPNEQSIIVEPLHLKRRPCSKLGNRCKYGKAQCIQEVDEKQITDFVNSFFV
jgi:ADP-heptose:LPS heptosyltransferase